MNARTRCPGADFSYACVGRPAAKSLSGKKENVAAAQNAFLHRAG